jgi:glutamyl/glutaminyl-tRNA synthetase
VTAIVSYRGRIAPSPTGLLHLGHACTFWTAYRRARQANGTLILRNEDLDPQRSKVEYVRAFEEDLRWLGMDWDEGPDVGGPFAPYSQSQRATFYLEAWRRLRDGGFLYPCLCSRKDLASAVAAPHEGDLSEDEPVYSGRCRSRASEARSYAEPKGVNWRFCVSDGTTIAFDDRKQGAQAYVAGRDFGDFVVWRRDNLPAYQLAVVADDAAMKITEVVRGADLLKSTARQILLYRALGWQIPAFYHCELLRDESGTRLAKRHDSLSIRRLRERGMSPGEILKSCLHAQGIPTCA